ncbi:hypothetical protein [Noviherbaspirillum massiliense]|uniref:hypothetical protein n=1 Tax=Noviherbaspirillum massiliense TaxID=1465823 RepID=UPI0003078B18|nr:hypothetical protein [Noviherbaspirillum massiliense]
MDDRYKQSGKAGSGNPAAPAFVLQVGAPISGRLGHRSLPDGASLLLRMHKLSDVCMRDLRGVAAEKPEKTG